MQESKEGGLVVEEKERAIHSLLNIEPRLSEIAEMKVHYIDNIDSTNMSPQHWDNISQVIADNYEQYDGFVITHGTNSMAYTASALSYTLGDIGKPVVLTGAQIPLSRLETDARRNFVNAVRVAALDICGVMLVFDEEIILGSRASKVSESRLDAFETINWDLLGEIRIDIRLGRDHKKRHKRALQLRKGFEENIAVLTIFPGMKTNYLFQLIDQGINGIVLKGFGPGDIAYEYVDLIKYAKSKKVPILVTTQCLEGATLMHINHVGKQALDEGAIQTYDMSTESITTKLMWALKNFPYEEIETVMHKSFTGEINKEGLIY